MLLAGTQDTYRPSRPISVQIPHLPHWAPAILVSPLPRVLALVVFCPLQIPGSQAPPISFLLSSNVSVSMKPVQSTVLRGSPAPLPISFPRHFTPTDRLASSLVCYSASLAAVRAPQGQALSFFRL